MIVVLVIGARDARCVLCVSMRVYRPSRQGGRPGGGAAGVSGACQNGVTVGTLRVDLGMDGMADLVCRGAEASSGGDL